MWNFKDNPMEVCHRPLGNSLSLCLGLTAHYLICLDLMNKSHVKGKYGIVHVLIETEDLLTIPQRLTDEGSAMASVVPPPYIW